MPILALNLSSEPLWPDLEAARVHNCGEVLQVGLLVNGTAEGRSVAVMRLDLPDGTSAIAQVTLDQLAEAVTAMRGRERGLQRQAQRTRGEA